MLAHLKKRFPQEPKYLAPRVAFLSISLSGFVLFSFYSSMISASLAVKKFYPPVNSLDEILDSPYNLIMTNGSSTHIMFKNAANDSVYAHLRNSGKILTVPRETMWIEKALRGIKTII